MLNRVLKDMCKLSFTKAQILCVKVLSSLQSRETVNSEDE